MIHTHKISVALAGKRIDRVVCELLPTATLTDITKLFRKGDVKLNGVRCKGVERTTLGDTLTFFAHLDALKVRENKRLEKSVQQTFEENFIILHEDGHYLVLDKPSGIEVHPGKGSKPGQTLIDLATHYATTMVTRSFTPKLVHRLDKETSGVLLIAKSDASLKRVTAAWESRTPLKRYLALCHGVFAKSKGVITAELERTSSEAAGMKMRVVSEESKKTRSEYQVVTQYGSVALVAIKLFSGKTHQIRTHMAHIGHPIVGDSRYGDAEKDRQLCGEAGPDRLFLHAERISFAIEGERRERTYVSDLPQNFFATAKLGGSIKKPEERRPSFSLNIKSTIQRRSPNGRNR